MFDFFTYPGAWEALFAVLVAGGFLGLLGLPLILQGRAFMGVALAEAAALGAAFGSVIGSPPYLVPFVCVFVTLLVLELIKSRRTASDGVVALVYITAAPFAILLVSKMPSGEADLLVMHYGNILAITPREVWLAFILSSLGLGTLVPVMKGLLATLNDRTSAQLSGYNTKFYLVLYAFLLSTAVTYSLSLFGVVLVFAFLVAPAFVSLRLFSSVFHWVVAIIGITFLISTMGLLFSFSLDFPPGPFIAGFLGVVATLCWIFRR